MNFLPESLRQLILHFDRLPGIGPRVATKLALFLTQQPDLAKKFAHDIEAAMASVRLCAQCQNVSDQELCLICRDPKRDQETICVVAEPQDIEALERVLEYTGVFHVLHGTIRPIEGVTPEHLKVKELLDRIKQRQVNEIILALDPTMDGEATTLYLTRTLKPLGIPLTKLARGLPMGSNIEYTDEVTLSSAMQNRKPI